MATWVNSAFDMEGPYGIGRAGARSERRSSTRRRCNPLNLIATNRLRSGVEVFRSRSAEVDSSLGSAANHHPRQPSIAETRRSTSPRSPHARRSGGIPGLGNDT
jgi:hypothetical protein